MPQPHSYHAFHRLDQTFESSIMFSERSLVRVFFFSLKVIFYEHNNESCSDRALVIVMQSKK